MTTLTNYETDRLKLLTAEESKLIIETYWKDRSRPLILRNDYDILFTGTVYQRIYYKYPQDPVLKKFKNYTFQHQNKEFKFHIMLSNPQSIESIRLAAKFLAQGTKKAYLICPLRSMKKSDFIDYIIYKEI